MVHAKKPADGGVRLARALEVLVRHLVAAFYIEDGQGLLRLRRSPRDSKARKKAHSKAKTVFQVTTVRWQLTRVMTMVSKTAFQLRRLAHGAEGGVRRAASGGPRVVSMDLVTVAAACRRLERDGLPRTDARR